MTIEIIVTSIEEARKAQEYGASRLELIHSFELGGLSPSLQLSQAVCDAVNIPVNIMVRPHGRSFCYNNTEISQIISEIEFLRDNTRANGIVFGALNLDFHIDTKLLEAVIAAKKHLSLTFHRAIDEAYNTLDAYKTLLKYKEIDLVLTSGGFGTAIEGNQIIKQMVELNSQTCQILAGSGVTPENAKRLIESTGVTQIHLGSGVRENNILSKTKFLKLLAELGQEHGSKPAASYNALSSQT